VSHIGNDKSPLIPGYESAPIAAAGSDFYTLFLPILFPWAHRMKSHRFYGFNTGYK
jgi:hypothetical protein